MKLWLVNYQGADGCFRSWHTNKLEAAREARRIAADMGEDFHTASEPRQVEVPTTRAALAEWLCKWAGADNG